VRCEEGEAGLLDRRLGKASGKRVPVARPLQPRCERRVRRQHGAGDDVPAGKG
jgi:hypothetical protein